MFRGKIKNIHFVGIGGSGMSGIAEVLINMGYNVTGSDLNEGDVVTRLRELGGTIQIGHDAQNVKDADVVVKSTAIPNHNVEIQAADLARIPVIPRAEMLAQERLWMASIHILTVKVPRCQSPAGSGGRAPRTDGQAQYAAA